MNFPSTITHSAAALATTAGVVRTFPYTITQSAAALTTTAGVVRTFPYTITQSAAALTTTAGVVRASPYTITQSPTLACRPLPFLAPVRREPSPARTAPDNGEQPGGPAASLGCGGNVGELG
ncbi:hypothetical protein [Acrocarpospora sp. B8E8]|uniref:hypothetical protein n=1 Tax=Acrocarpospora sp. B8E8 TaxID=3153572 RepID=UPI00325EFD9B